MRDRSFYWCRSCRQPLYATSSPALPAGWDWEVDHQQPGDCANGYLMPLTGTAPVPEDLPNAPRVLRVFGA
ncbi:hypothetical protein ADK52_05785 [Streptomyces sp. WM6372]|uniref:hypothetical protein n=1 Tax=Streptomyces sp. WM6372 TaxID=1415555 RepID=UPI0006AF2199|nr:hypothetical protein [Streptomyces sp. WM6372]KOU29476.1 hypothetical protein ADK52_05785 [Streptomyces sp. WM6372]